ncbi:ketosteroid isomerase-like protein [Arthrobacter sp. B3I9]|uniref:nuclear transport factor 2 family protein n=1 Tax=Arthrobacter sp. B3I9 TaxID=3042270 RepID=UPI0027921F01|nr:nuclear transport factor 2 family protein [Arthrobacter sp. B3I9]MDQ0851882.1 ketosteroid isomerase-like protein [Arthrobacter sp. B3I9]
MSERDDFMAWVGLRLKDAEIALHNGDAAPRSAIWSTREPVTVLGAWTSGSGPEEVGHIFRQLEASFSDCTSYSHEVIAADVMGDLAYTVGYEHTSASVNGVPRDYTLRVTQIYRREEGEWKVAHRHADTLEQADKPQGA